MRRLTNLCRRCGKEGGQVAVARGEVQHALRLLVQIPWRQR